MKIDMFNRILKANNALFLDDDYIIFNDYELYSRKQDTSIPNKTLEELLENKIGDKTIRELIEEKDEFYLQADMNGGRGSSSGSGKQMGFGNAPGRRGNDREVLLNAELNLDQASGNSVESVLSRFKNKYGKSDREYAIAVDENGYVHQHIKGGKHSVGISGDKGEIIIHNHPSGSNFSQADLENVASTKAKGVIATSSNGTTKGTYTFIKTDKFKSKEFMKALNKARWDSSIGYNKGVSNWLRANQKTYGYTFSAKGVRNANW